MSLSSSPTILPQSMKVNPEMTRHMKDIFDKATDPDFKERKRIDNLRKDFRDKSELGI